MPKARPLSPAVSLIRPLIAVRRVDVLQYLTAIGQDYRVDATNADPRFTRNRIRHALIPIIRSQFNAQFDEQILSLAQQAGETQAMIAQFAADLSADCVETKPSVTAPEAEIRIHCRKLANHPAPLIREVCKTAWASAGWPLQSMGFGNWQQLAALVAESRNNVPIFLPGGIRAELDGNTLLLRRQQ